MILNTAGSSRAVKAAKSTHLKKQILANQITAILLNHYWKS